MTLPALMPRRVLSGASALSSLCLTACAVNSVVPITNDSDGPRHGRSMLVYGVGIETRWPYAGFAIELDQYDLGRRRVAGDCLTFDRTVAVVSNEPNGMRYFVFDVPAGHYAWSGFNGVPLHQAANAGSTTEAFDAKANRVVFVGIYVYRRSGEVDLERDLGDARTALSSTMPRIAAKMEPAQADNVPPPSIFLCAP